MHKRVVGRVGPQLGAVETHVIGGLVVRGHAVGVRVGEWVGRRDVHHHPGFAPDVAGCTHMAAHMLNPHLHLVTHAKCVRIGGIAAPRAQRQGQRKAATGALLQIAQTEHALFHAQGGQAGQGALVIARAHVMARLHALNGVAVFVHVEDAGTHRHTVEGIDAFFPFLMEHRCIGAVHHGPKALPATEVVHAVHALTTGSRQSWRLC